MKNKAIKMTCLAGVLLAVSAVSQVATAGLSANAAATSNYVWRGTTQTGNGAAVSGGVDYEAPFGIYAGTWASNTTLVGSKGSVSQELDLYAGWAHEFGPVGFDVGVIRYGYPQAEDIDWIEGYVGASFRAGPVDLSAQINVSNDVFGTDENGLYVEFSAETDIKGLALAAHVGRYDFEFGDRDETLSVGETYAAYDDYIDYSISVSKDAFTFALSGTTLSGDIDTANAVTNTGGAMGDAAFVADDDYKVTVTYAKDFTLLK